MVVQLAGPPSRPLVQWVKGRNPYVVEDLRADGPIGAIGLSIVDAPQLDRQIAAATERGFGTIVDTEPYRVQLEPGHPYRSNGYRDSGLEWLKDRFDPSGMELSAASRTQLVAMHRDAQAAAGATMFLWSGHCVPDAAPLTKERRQEVQIAADFLALARASGATHPAPQSGAPRSVAVGLAVDAKHLTQRVVGELVAAYSELDPDLFWISCWNFTRSALQYRELRYLARLLQRETGKRCLIAGIGALWEGALRNSIAAGCQGWGRGSLEYPPPPQPPPSSGEQRGAAYAIAAFHLAIRGAVPPGSRYARAAAELYARHPCPCDNHPQALPPEGQRECHLHNRYWAEYLAEAAVAEEPDQATEALGPTVMAAENLRQELGFGRLPSAWKIAATDPSDAKRLEVPAELWLPRVV